MRKKKKTTSFWTAYISIPLWSEFIAWYNGKESEIIVLDIVDLLFGKLNASATMLIILMKKIIYKQRVNKSIAGFIGFILYLKYHQTIEKNIIFKKNMIQKFDIKWINCKLVWTYPFNIIIQILSSKLPIEMNIYFKKEYDSENLI